MTNGTSEIRSHSGLVVWGCTISTVNGVHRHFKRLGMAFLYIILRETDSKILIEFNGRLVRLTIKKDIPKESETFDRTECILSKTYKMIADKPTGKIVTHIVGGNYSKIKIQKCSLWQARLLYLSNFVCYYVLYNKSLLLSLLNQDVSWLALKLWQVHVDSGLPGFTPRMNNNISSMTIRFLSDPSGLFLLAKECTRPMPAFEWGVINTIFATLWRSLI